MELFRRITFATFLLLPLSNYAQSTDSLPVQKSVIFQKIKDTAHNQLIILYKNKEMTFDSRGALYFVRYLPNDMWQLAKSPFEKSNLKGLIAVAASTAILIPFDQSLLKNVQDASKKINLSEDNHYGVAWGIGKTKIIKYPRNFNAALYQLGEGGTSLVLAGGLWVYGKIQKDYRAVQTAGDLAETFIVMGVGTQILKRISGRESPFMATKKNGAWRPFPSFKEYADHTSKYDAIPSRHLATMMATVTTLALDYPEKKWIRPVGYSLMALTSWAMVNSEVHWISDYPLALAIGYLSGKISTMRHIKKPSVINTDL